MPLPPTRSLASNARALHRNDGLVDSLFLFLATSLPSGSSPPRVRIPDTVVWRSGMLEGWYDYASACVQRRSRTATTSEIERVLLARAHAGCDVVAVFVVAGASALGGDDRAAPTVEYLTRETLHALLAAPPRACPAALLQTFVPPRGLRNAVMRAVWTPLSCRIEVSAASPPLFLSPTEPGGPPIAARCATWDARSGSNSGIPPPSATLISGTHVCDEIVATCEAICDHIAEVTHHTARVSTLVTLWKHGYDGHLYLMWAPTCALEDASLSERGFALRRRAAHATVAAESLNVSDDHSSILSLSRSPRPATFPDAAALLHSSPSPRTAATALLRVRHEARLALAAALNGVGSSPSSAATAVPLSAASTPGDRIAATPATHPPVRALNADIIPHESPDAVLAVLIKRGGAGAGGSGLGRGLVLGEGSEEAEARKRAVLASVFAAFGSVSKSNETMSPAAEAARFDVITQCPACGGALSAWATGTARGGGAFADEPGPHGLPVSYRVIIAHYNLVLRVLRVAPHNDSSMRVVYMGGAFDGDAATAVRPLDSAYYPHRDTVVAATGGGMGLIGAVLVTLPLPPVIPPLPPPPPKFTRSVFRAKSGITIAEGLSKGLGDRNVEATRIAELKEQRLKREEEAPQKAAEARAAEEEAARHDWVAAINAKRPVVEVPPVLSLVSSPRLTRDLFREWRHDPLYLGRTARVCERCYACYSAVVAHSTQPDSLAVDAMRQAMKSHMELVAHISNRVQTQSQELAAVEAQMERIRRRASVSHLLSLRMGGSREVNEGLDFAHVIVPEPAVAVIASSAREGLPQGATMGALLARVYHRAHDEMKTKLSSSPRKGGDEHADEAEADGDTTTAWLSSRFPSSAPSMPSTAAATSDHPVALVAADVVQVMPALRPHDDFPSPLPLSPLVGTDSELRVQRGRLLRQQEAQGWTLDSRASPSSTSVDALVPPIPPVFPLPSLAPDVEILSVGGSPAPLPPSPSLPALHIPISHASPPPRARVSHRPMTAGDVRRSLAPLYSMAARLGLEAPTITAVPSGEGDDNYDRETSVSSTTTAARDSVELAAVTGLDPSPKPVPTVSSSARARARRGERANPFSDDVVGEWSVDGLCPEPPHSRGILAVAICSFGSSRKYLAIVRRPHMVEVRGVTWRTPMHGRDGSPFVVSLCSLRSGRVVTQFMRLGDLRGSGNSLLRSVAEAEDDANTLANKRAAGALEGSSNEEEDNEAVSLWVDAISSVHVVSPGETKDSHAASPPPARAASAVTAIPTSPPSTRTLDSSRFRDPKAYMAIASTNPALSGGMDLPSMQPSDAIAPFLTLVHVCAVGLSHARSRAVSSSGHHPLRRRGGPHATPYTNTSIALPCTDPAAYRLVLLAAGTARDVSRAIPEMLVPRMRTLLEHGAAREGGLTLPAHSHPAPEDLPSGVATRAALCTTLHTLLSSIEQPVFLIRRYNPATGACELETSHAARRRSVVIHAADEQLVRFRRQSSTLGVGSSGATSGDGRGMGGRRGSVSSVMPDDSSSAASAAAGGKEQWLSFAQLAHPARRVHPSILYAAKCRLLSLAPACGLRTVRVSGFDDSMPLPGTVMRLVPGHWLGGRASLDRARGFVASLTSHTETSIAAYQLRALEEATLRDIATHEKSKAAARAAAMAQGIRAVQQGASPLHTHFLPPKSTPKGLDDMRPIDVKLALESVNIARFASTEEAIMHTAEVFPEGVIAQRVIVRPDKSVLHCQLLAGFPNEMDEDKDALLRRAAAEVARMGASQFASAAARVGGADVNARFAYRLRVFASSTGAVTVRWVSAQDLLVPLVDPYAFDKGLPPEVATIPGNPFLDIASLLAIADTPVAKGETVLAASLLGADTVQRFLGAQDAGSVNAVRRHPLGPHSSVPLGGTYSVSLWVRPPRDRSGAPEKASVSEATTSASMAQSPWDWAEGDEGHPLAAGLRSTLVEAHAAATLGVEAQQLHIEPPQRPGVPRYTLRCQYIQQPYGAWDAPEAHDAAMGGLRGAHKGARLVSAEMSHWCDTGNMPSSARLPTLALRENDFAYDFPRVRQQAQGSCAPWGEPAYAYAATLAQLRCAALNPLLERTPLAKGVVSPFAAGGETDAGTRNKRSVFAQDARALAAAEATGKAVRAAIAELEARGVVRMRR